MSDDRDFRRGRGYQPTLDERDRVRHMIASMRARLAAARQKEEADAETAGSH